MTINLQPFLLSVDDYHRMREAGILTEDDRVELIRGQIYYMSPKGSRHSNTVNRLTKLFLIHLMDKAEVHSQNPIRLSNASEPEPDLALLTPPLSRYDDRLPIPEDVILAVEVADTSLAHDQNLKVSLYGQAGIPELWIVNLQENEVEVYQQPQQNGYRIRTRYQAHEQIELPLTGKMLSIAEMLGLSNENGLTP